MLKKQIWDFETGRCKSWTLDSGMDRGLDGGLDFGPNFGLSFGLVIIMLGLACFF